MVLVLMFSGAERSGTLSLVVEGRNGFLNAIRTSTSTTEMAPSATNGDALAVLDEIRAPAGVVIPPKEIKGDYLFITYDWTCADRCISYSREDRWIRRTKWHSL